MKLDKNQLRGFVVLAIVFVAFSVVAFALPFSMNGVFWLAYVFTVLAIVAQVYVFRVAFEKGEPVKSKFYGFPIARIGFIYLVAQLLLGIAFMALAKFAPAWLAVVVFVLLLAAAGIGFVAADVMRDEVEKQEVQLQRDVSAMRAMQTKVCALADHSADPAMKDAVAKLSEEFRFSDPVSGETTAAAEQALMLILDDIQNAVLGDDANTTIQLCRKCSLQLAERNRLCKMGKIQ